MRITPSSGQSPVPHGTAIDPTQLRSVMGAFPTGVAVITTGWKGELYGAAINSLASVSLEPCMLLFCANEGSATAAAIRFQGLALAFSAEGLPLRDGASARLCCRLADVHTFPSFYVASAVLYTRALRLTHCFHNNHSAVRSERNRQRRSLAHNAAALMESHTYPTSRICRRRVGAPAGGADEPDRSYRLPIRRQCTPIMLGLLGAPLVSLKAIGLAFWQSATRPMHLSCGDTKSGKLTNIARIHIRAYQELMHSDVL